MAYVEEHINTYKNISGNSGISEYLPGDDYINVKFIRGGVYRYGRAKIGSAHLETMMRLAEEGAGLNTFINKHPIVKKSGVQTS